MPDFEELEGRLRTNDASLTNLVLANQDSIPRSVVEALTANHTVRTVHLEMTVWTDDKMIALRDLGGLTESVTGLYMSRNKITSDGLPALCEAVLSRGSRL